MSAYSALVNASSPAGYWRLGEASGTIAADSSGNARTGTYSGGVTLAVPGAIFGDPNTSASFDGTGIVTIADTASLRFATSFTLEIWAKWPSTPGTSVMISKWDPTLNYWFGIIGGNIAFFLDGGASGALSATIPSNNVWHHLVAVADAGASTRSIYVDGSLAGSNAYDGDSITGTGDVAIAGIAGAPSWASGLDEVAVYPTALSPAVIASHYQAGANGQYAGAGLRTMGLGLSIGF